ncbi:DUF4129 domain-containing protein [Nesterenkonia haasae]|uniref:DUF4129 domain-containing protein n=1 Tax=Nesterenkonia haasae TaxID=2587813 RepID=UPI001390AC61|nr:DUF4129 domain-containing protein [Nesterenkonia haasae]NDK31353.1 DUF4129 domain-containing protein [Nesterenkonia haasae]
MTTELYERDDARRVLETELADGSYQRQFTGPLREAIDSFLDWLQDRAFSIGGVDVPFGPVLVVLVVAAAVVVIILVVRPRLQSGTVTEGIVEIDPRVSAEQFRTRAQEAARSGDFNAAALDAFRAVARAAEERGVASEQQGRTATEIANGLGVTYRAFAADLHRAAELFNRSVYGSASLVAADFEFVAQLDVQLQTATAQPRGGVDGPRLAVPQ